MLKHFGCTKRSTVGAFLWLMAGKSISIICSGVSLRSKTGSIYSNIILASQIIIAAITSPPFIMVEDWSAVPQMLAELLRQPEKVLSMHQHCADWWSRYRISLQQLVFRVVNDEKKLVPTSKDKGALLANASAASQSVIDNLLVQLEMVLPTSMDEAKAKQVWAAPVIATTS
jgi:hypothetical protein